MSEQKGSNGEQSIRIVYCGPSESGKTTNLEVLARVLPSHTRGSLLQLATETNRTLYFDLLRIELASRSGSRTTLELYTVPGQSFYLPARRRVLREAHGVVFVADSRRERLDANVEALNDVAAAIQDAGRDVADVPAVLQLNKCDAATAIPSGELLAALGCDGEPYVEAIAHEGRGVVETLRRIAKFTIAGQLVAETI